MRTTWLSLMLLLTSAFGLSTWLEQWFQSWAGNRTQSANLLAVAMGDSRKLFANHIYAKADCYFHRGFYPSIFDYHEDLERHSLSEQIGLQAQPSHACTGSHLTEPLDWLDRFSRHFYPSRHTHLGEDTSENPDPHHDKDDEPGATGNRNQPPRQGLEREILPWLRLSAGLDPNRVETFVVAAYWLRKELGKIDEAEQFLRQGLRTNPGSQEILFELGRIYHDDRKDMGRARNLWELALQCWEKNEAAKPDPNIFLYAQILGNLGRLEEEDQNYSQAIVYLEMLARVSPNATSIRKWIAELRQKQAGK